MAAHGMLDHPSPTGRAQRPAPHDEPFDDPHDEPFDEYVVLVDPTGRPTGRALKSDVHSADTPLHLAFSLYLFDRDDNLLLTRRALTKKTWPGVWTNTCCGHPAPGEDPEDAIRRRTFDELGLRITQLRCVLPDFSYSAVDASGVWENEVCPVFAAQVDPSGPSFTPSGPPATPSGPTSTRSGPPATTSGDSSASRLGADRSDVPHPYQLPEPNPAEVVEWSWIPWPVAVRSILGTPFAFSPWAVDQVRRLDRLPGWSSARGDLAPSRWVGERT